MLRAPLISEYDPSEEGEGSIDPMGLGPAYERLADKLLPAVTVRMGRPRFVTAMAVGAIVCQGWDEEDVAKDEVTPPWLVFEWFVVEAFVRARDSLKEPRGIPGVQKVERALRNQRPVSASSYLKTPNVFGFSGVFRRLARHLGVLTEDGRLDSNGCELVSAWAKDQELAGFLDGSGPGAAFRDRVCRAVQQGMDQGHTSYQPATFWQEISVRLDPARPGMNERRILLQLLANRSGDPEKVAALIDVLKAAGGPLDKADEPPLLRGLARKASFELRELLSAIDDYEAFCRPTLDAFNWLRYLSTLAQGALIGADELANCKASSKLLRALKDGLDRVGANARLLEWEPHLVNAKAHFEVVRSAEELFGAVLAYHEKVQRDKLPEGKRPWFERGRDQKVVVRPGYALDEAPENPLGYVHEYRTPTFSRFLADLGAFK